MTARTSSKEIERQSRAAAIKTLLQIALRAPLAHSLGKPITEEV